MKLKELRQNKKKEVKEIANFLNITEQAYYKYESNKNEPSLTNLKKLADYYGVSLDYLVGRNFNNEFGYIEKADKETIKLFLTLNEINKVKVASFIAGLLAVQN